MENKDFDAWSNHKKEIEHVFVEKYSHPREVWWCSLGVNIGAEVDGKNNKFERPVVIMKVYNKQTLVVLPLTTKEKIDKFHFKLRIKEDIDVWVKLTQMRVISSKRLIRRVDFLSEEVFSELKSIWLDSLCL